MKFWVSMVFSTDDLSTENLEYFKYWDYVKQTIPDFKMIAFVIAEGLDGRFGEWFQSHKDWVEIGVHCYNHDRVQEGWRDDQEYWIEKAVEVLRPFLPKRYLYRPPGFRFLAKTEKIIKKIGFSGIAHQEFIKYFDINEKLEVFNTHCTLNQYKNPIGAIWKKIIENH